MPTERHVIARVHELPPGSRKIVEIGKRSIGVFNIDGNFYAIRNQCPHQGAPLCRGTLSGTMIPAGPKEYQYGMEGRVLRCPWHSWEFDVTTGAMIFMPQPMRVKQYAVAVENAVDHAGESPVLETFPVVVEVEDAEDIAGEDAVVVLYL